MNRYWDKALKAAGSARLLLREGDMDAASNRAYNALFNAVRALLQEHGVNVAKVKTHSGVAHLLGERLVSQSLVDRSVSQALRQADDTRRLGDYDTRSASAEEANAAVDDMERALSIIEAVLKSKSSP